MCKVLVVSGGNVVYKELSKIVDNFDKVIAVDKGLECMYALNKLPDYIVGDFDSVNSEIIEYYRNQNTKICEYDSEKDYTDTEIGLDMAISLEPDQITIVGGIGTRMDHTLANIHIMKKCLDKGVYCEIIDNNNKIYLVDSFKEISKELTFGKYVSIIPLTTIVEEITLKGFKYPLEKYTLEVRKEFRN